MFSIYALIDPRDNAVRYIGMTDDVYQRFVQHLRCDGSNYRRDAWIAELKGANRMVVMTTLQEVSSAVEAHEREAYWIHHYLMLGANLCNNTVPTPFHLRSISEQKRKGAQIIDAHISVLLAHTTSKREAVRELRAQGYGKQAIIEKVWGVKKGGSPRYQQAEQAYEALVAQRTGAEEAEP